MNKRIQPLINIARLAACAMVLAFAAFSAQADTLRARGHQVGMATEVRDDVGAMSLDSTLLDCLVREAEGREHCRQRVQDVQSTGLLSLPDTDEPAPVSFDGLTAVRPVMADPAPGSVHDPVPKIPRFILFRNFRS